MFLLLLRSLRAMTLRELSTEDRFLSLKLEQTREEVPAKLDEGLLLDLQTGENVLGRGIRLMLGRVVRTRVARHPPRRRAIWRGRAGFGAVKI
jgi:hypothetical protein